MYFQGNNSNGEKGSNIELVELSKHLRDAVPLSDSLSKNALVPHHIPIELSHNPSLHEITNLCIHLGTPIKMHRFTGALTNLVWKVDLRSNKSIILRIYGTDSDLLIDREIELNHFIKISEYGIGPKCLVTFSNGRIEEYLNASSLTSEKLRTETYAIAEAMVKFHSIPAIQSNIVLWDMLYKWYHIALKALSENSKVKDLVEKTLNIHSIENDIRELKEKVGTNHTAIVFAHNDLQYGNIMKFNGHDRLIFLDYEYSGTNYLEYDLANFFCEWMGDYHSTTPHLLDKTKYPSQKEQESFIMHYLKTKQPTESDDGNMVSLIMQKIPLFTACSHLLWGLWGIIHGCKSDEKDQGFDYQAYGLNRLVMYSEIKPQLIS